MQFILMSELDGHFSWNWKDSGIFSQRVDEYSFIVEVQYESQQEGSLEIPTI